MRHYFKTYLLRFELSLILIPLLLILFWPNLLSNFFNSNYMPHGHCYMWMPDLVSLHVFSDFFIGAAYISIAVTLGYLVIKAKNDIPFHKMFLAFGIFIITCGLTHFVAVWTLWDAVYWLSGSVKLVTAVASVATAIALPYVIPQIKQLIKSAKLSEERRIKLEEAYEELKSLNIKLKDLDQLKTRFFASVSHELRTPLSLILGPAEQLSLDPEIPEEKKKDIKTIENNAYTLLKYVNDLLDISRLEEDRLKPVYTVVNLKKLLLLAVDNFRSLAGRIDIDFSVKSDEEIVTKADKDKVNRIIYNLLSNAFKFTPSKGKVECELKTSGDNIIFTVEDSGPGIKPEHRKKIFDRFEQIHETRSKRFGGTGLGLSITKEFTELHNGSISVHDSYLGGVKFMVVLPLIQPEETEIIKEETGNDFSLEKQSLAEFNSGIREVNNKHISTENVEGIYLTAEKSNPVVLIVEDNVDMNNFIRRTLLNEYNIVTAFNGREALEILNKVKPDLIITDLMMPEMNGEQMLNEIKKNKKFSDIPVMLLSAKADDEVRIKMLREGAKDYLMKPFSTEELILRAQNLINMKKAVAVLQDELKSQNENITQLVDELAQRKKNAEASLKEKEILLKEIHHRVKNNLQVISSLFNLQTSYIKDPEIEEIFRDLQNRVKSMALIHEKLYHSEDFAFVDFSDFVQSLTRQLLSSYSLKTNIELISKIDKNIKVTIETGVPLGIIINELVSNSIKYAFPDDMQGTIEVIMTEDSEKNIELIVRDNGIGFPEHINFEAAKSLGLRLVHTLIDQIDGTIKLNVNQGTEFRINLKL